MLKFRCEFMAKNMKLFFNFTSIAATKMRPLSHKTPQSFHRPRYCGVQTFPLKMHYGGEKLGKEWSNFDPKRKGSCCWGSGLRCKVSSKLSENYDCERGDRQKDRHTDASDFIICPMLCYSNGTDKNGPSLGLYSPHICPRSCWTNIGPIRLITN